VCVKLDNIIITEDLKKGEMCGGIAGRGKRKMLTYFGKET